MSQKGGKAAKGKKPGGKAGAEEKHEDALQAVILADYFQDRFMPFALEKPRCLLPLANTPLIEYTLEFLDMNGVEDVIIYTGNHTDQIEDYINRSPRWSPTSKINPFSSLEFIRVSDASSIGDFLRDLDGRGLVSGDFILVHGDCVGNIQLDAALAAHKARREANREAIMTVVLRPAGLDAHRTKAKGITPVFAVESNTNRCLHYEEMHPLQSDHYATLDPAIFEHEAVEIRTDLIDPGIDICTPDVLALWSESFDYELPRKNFLHGVLKDWELNGKFIYTHIVEEGYAARASNLQMYDSITKDVLGRWTFPLVPDSNLVSGHSYVMTKGGVCREKGVMIEADTVISKSVFGARSTVSSGSRITNSVIGRRCFIGKNVTIEDSYIWDDAVIEDGSTVIRSVLGESATVGKNCKIGAGSLISNGVTVSDDRSLPPSSVLSILSHDRKLVPNDTKLLGPKGKGAIFKYEEEEDEIDPADPSQLQKTLIYSVEKFNISTSSVSTLSSDIESDSEDDEPALAADPIQRSRLSSFASDDSGSGSSKASFHKEAVNGLLDALRGDVDDFDSAKLEFMGLRLSQDASDTSVRRAVASAFVRRAAELLTPSYGGPLEPPKAAERAIASKKGTAKFLREVGVGSGSRAEQVEFVLAVQKALVGHSEVETPRAGTLLAAMLQHMYNNDVVEEDGILAWWADKRAAEGESMSAVKGRCKVLVDWLQEDDDSSDEDDDDDDEDSD
ncbi:putative translation initiation factor eIF-2B subunit epsilon [Cytospora mali]|uniref:Mannose-1-phosphate guanyltransferase n=1 Tax=Cytospora mali TaxID=578113 RepID=A0A194W740_CYTMA|nr:putative translation initiation factor eIF-2B subunit epsilon [Valsa mali]